MNASNNMPTPAQSLPPAAGEAAHTLPAVLRLVRTHPNEETRRELLELVSHDGNDFGREEAMFFCAPDGSHRAAIAQACVDRYNAHDSDQRLIRELADIPLTCEVPGIAAKFPEMDDLVQRARNARDGKPFVSSDQRKIAALTEVLEAFVYKAENTENEEVCGYFATGDGNSVYRKARAALSTLNAK